MSEIRTWANYRAKRGSLNTGRRVEQAIGNLMAMYVGGKVGKSVKISPIDFMPNEDQIVQKDNDFENYMASMIGK